MRHRALYLICSFCCAILSCGGDDAAGSGAALDSAPSAEVDVIADSGAQPGSDDGVAGVRDGAVVQDLPRPADDLCDCPEAEGGGDSGGSDRGDIADEPDGADRVDASDTPADAAAADEGGATADAGGSTWPSDRPAGQCAVSGDCSTGDCNRRVPGGFCIGCSSELGENPCPSGYDCFQGTCNPWCDDDDECPAGLRCLQSKGFCVPMPCSSDTDCPGPLVCGLPEIGQCRRPLCGEGDPCPAPFTCRGGVCIEPGR